MKCCRKQNNNRWAEKVILERIIQSNGKCPICFQQANDASILFDSYKYEDILGLRQSLLKTYVSLPKNQKPEWKTMIDDQFGQGYTAKHLEGHPFNLQL